MPVDFRGGVITYDNLLWALEDPQIAEEPDLVEDLLQVSYGAGSTCWMWAGIPLVPGRAGSWCM